MTPRPPAARDYVAAVVRLYLSLPGTPSRASRQDRRLARSLFDHNVPLATIRAALIVAVARRAFRPETAPPLAPIRTLHYFLPALDELQHIPPEPGYLDYLAAKLRPLVQQKIPALPISQPSKNFTS